MSSPDWSATSPPPRWLADCHAVLGDRLAAVYLVGSASLGDWHAGVSDLDVLVASDSDRLPALAERIAASAAALPARRLELVVYAPARLARGDATFSMNLNVDRDGPVTVDLDPATVPRFWFVLDLAIAARHAVALHGRAAIAAPGDDEVRAALEACVDWFAGSGDAEATLLAGVRALHWLRTGTWASKTAAARWAAGELPELAPALRAVLRRRSGRGP